MNSRIFTLGTMTLALILAGCASNPLPSRESLVSVPAAYKEAAGEGAWKLGQPAAQADRGEWWSIFGDAQLASLIDEATRSSPTLAVVAARVKQARGLAGVVDADRGVQVSAGFGPTRLRDAQTSPTTTWSALVGASYEVDLFGRLANASNAAKLDAQSQEAAYRSALLALQADVAQTYYRLRALDREREIFRASLALREEAVQLVQRRFDSGDTSELDLTQARTELATTQAEAIALEGRRSQLDHALAVLLGKPPADFSLAAAAGEAEGGLVPPQVPAGLPSELLERRPDVAAAQFDLAAANARVGLAKASFFPRLVLTITGGFESPDLENLFKWSSRAWAAGPLVGTMLTAPILDGGRNRSNLLRAEGGYEEAVSNYRQQVLVAFREVEDNLVGLRTLADQEAAQRRAVESARQSAKLSDSRYRNGLVSYFEVIDSQRARLAAERQYNQIASDRVVSMVALIRALGGGWS